MYKSILGTTKIIGLVGNPVGHSISPVLHNTLAQKYNLDIVYVPFLVNEDCFEDAIKGLRALNVEGFNVTVPYKTKIMQYMDRNTESVFLMGAVNTVKNIKGKFYGYNTDGEGFNRAFKEETKTDFKNKKVAILGAGGSARSIGVIVAQNDAEQVVFINRTLEKAEEIETLINQKIKKVAKSFDFGNENFKNALIESEIIINTTSMGMHPDIDDSPISDLECFNRQVVYDVIYNPMSTKFLKDAKSRGCHICNGLGMLFYQGILAFEIWTGIEISDNCTYEMYKFFTEYTNKMYGNL